MSRGTTPALLLVMPTLMMLSQRTVHLPAHPFTALAQHKSSVTGRPLRVLRRPAVVLEYSPPVAIPAPAPITSSVEDNSRDDGIAWTLASVVVIFVLALSPMFLL
jgi:hypothetical protein